MAEDISISSETKKRLLEELEELTTSGRAAMAQRLQTAREMGDLKENSEYHSAKDAQGMMEARIRQLQHTLKNAVVRDVPADTEAVEPGLIVKVREGDDEEEYLLAQSNEEKVPGVRTVTTSSPLGKALLGRSVGDSADVEAPGGKFTVEVTGIRSI